MRYDHGLFGFTVWGAAICQRPTLLWDYLGFRFWLLTLPSCAVFFATCERD